MCGGVSDGVSIKAGDGVTAGVSDGVDVSVGVSGGVLPPEVAGKELTILFLCLSHLHRPPTAFSAPTLISRVMAPPQYDHQSSSLFPAQKLCQ